MDVEQAAGAAETAEPTTNATGAEAPAFDVERAKKLAIRCIERARNNTAKKARDRQDWENCLFDKGGDAQWSIWNGDRFEARGNNPELGGIPDYVPRCVTNIYSTKIDGIASILDQSSPAKEVGPGTDDDKDRAAAEVAEDALPVILDEVGYDRRDRAQINRLATLTSLVGYTIFYDADPRYGMSTMHALQCADPQCAEFALPDEVEDTDGACPKCGGAMQDAIDPRTGEPIGLDFPIGRLVGDVYSSFEVSLPPGARTTDTTKNQWVVGHRRLAKEDIIRYWPNAKKALDADGDESSGGRMSFYADALTSLVSPAGSSGGGDARKLGPVVHLVMHDPIEDDPDCGSFPDGAFVVMINDEVAHAGPLPYKDEDGRPFKHFLIRTYTQSAGTALAKPPADDLIPLQKQRNLLESLATLSMMHFAAPREYVPLTVTFETEPSGAPGERVFYRSTTPGDKPTVADGHGPHDSVWQQIDRIDEKMEVVSKLNAVLQGQRPEGQPTLGEIQILQERGMSAFKGPLDEQVAFETALCTMALRIASQTMWAPRFLKVRGENGAWDVKQFFGTNLAGKLDVYIDRSTAWPKSPLMQNLRMEKALQLGVLPPPAEDPELASKILQNYDLSNLKPSLDDDRRQIARELDVWKDATSPEQIQPPDPLVQNLKLHFTLKQNFMKTEEAEAMKRDPARAPVYDAMRMHLEQLQQALAPAPAKPAPGGSSIDDMVNAGVLQPAGADQAGADVGSLLSAGVLHPAPSTEQAARA